MLRLLVELIVQGRARAQMRRDAARARRLPRFSRWTASPPPRILEYCGTNSCPQRAPGPHHLFSS